MTRIGVSRHCLGLLMAGCAMLAGCGGGGSGGSGSDGGGEPAPPIISPPAPAPTGSLTLVAGALDLTSNGQGTADGNGAAARFLLPGGLAFDAAGNLFVADSSANTIRSISPAGDVSTIAPGLGFDAAGNIYLSTFFSLARIGSDKLITKLADAFNQGLTVTPDGTAYYIEGNCIRKLSPAGVVTTIAGDVKEAGSADGTGAQARFGFLTFQTPLAQGGAMVVDSAGNLIVGDGFNHTVRKVTPAGVVTTVAGVAGVAAIGLGSLPGRLYFPNGLALRDDKTLYVSSRFAVLKISLP